MRTFVSSTSPFAYIIRNKIFVEIHINIKFEISMVQADSSSKLLGRVDVGASRLALLTLQNIYNKRCVS